MISVKIEIENIAEFKKLLTTARKQLKQLENTIGQLNEFELKIKNQVDEKYIR
ncbi:hypothetical protein [Limosilactobacillus vaginalis]|uniref:hypothetical protein n=1 Tax=Limosilactobacillus vaginalis TaxID=1633 RepID=UPI003736C8C3